MKVDLQGRMKMDPVTFFLSWISIFSYPGVNSGSPDVQKHLDMGRKFLENRQFHDALTQFHEAVELDPDNYQTYFKRALVFLALGKYNQALKDFDRVIDIKPDFSSAHLQRATLLMKQGQLDEAHINFEHVLRHDPDNFEATSGYQSVDEAWKLKEELTYYAEMNDCNTQVDLLSKLIEISPWDPSLRHLRSDCYLTLGESSHAVSDLRFTTRLTMDDTDGYYRLSSLQYQLGELEEALKEIRECLKLDPEHKLCFPLYKTLKKLDKSYQSAMKAGESEQYADCIADVKKALKADSKLPSQIEYKLRHKLGWCHLKSGQGDLAVDHCSRAIKISEDVEVLCDRAEGYLLDDLFEQAINDYKRVLELEDDNRRGREGLSRAQKLQKQSKKRDYYKILGVTKKAKKAEIVKAYRKLAQKWHPDNFHGDAQKAAQAKFIDIAAAKEVLTDPDKRAKFDNGEDPLDPEAQSGGHHHGGQGFPFFFQNSGGFNFKFNM